MHRRGQSLLEYSILIIIILGVFLAMNMYVKRGIQGRWKSSVDTLGDQYDPRVTNSLINYSITSSANTSITTQPDNNGSYVTMRVDTSNSVETKAGNTTVGAVSTGGT